MYPIPHLGTVLAQKLQEAFLKVGLSYTGIWCQSQISGLPSPVLGSGVQEIPDALAEGSAYLDSH